MKLFIFRILYLQQILASPSLPKAKYSKCIVEDGGNVEVSGIQNRNIFIKYFLMYFSINRFIHWFATRLFDQWSNEILE